MIEPIHADGARLLPSAATTPAATKRAAASDTSFAGQLARLSASSRPDAGAKPAGTVKAATRPDNEHTTKVAGHPFARIENGADKGLYLNQLDGSPREGAVFRLVERDSRVFHVYGEGKDKVVVEVKPKAKTGSAAPQATGGAAPTAS